MPDEWIGSWIVRLAAANYAPLSVSPRRFLNTLGIDSAEKHLTDNELLLLSEATLVDLDTLQTLNTLPADLIPHTARGRAHNHQTVPIPFLGVSYLVVCPECMKGDQQPYFRRSWLSQSTFMCSSHGGPLYDGCPHCDMRLGIPMTTLASLSKRFIPPGIPHYPERNLRQCWRCQGDLAAQSAPLELLPPDIEKLPRQFSAGFKCDPPAWTAFIRGLRLYLRAYGLATLVDPGQVKLLFFRPEVGSPMTTQARFRAERIMAWLLIPRAEKISHPYRQIQLMAGTVLGLLSVTLRTDSARRWLHVAWLSTRLLQDTPRTILKSWPDQVTALVALFEEEIADPRQTPDPAFKLHDEPWQLMAPLLDSALAIRPLRKQLGANLTPEESRMNMDSILQNLAGFSWKDMNDSRRERGRLEAWRAYWKEDGRLGMALGQLHRAVVQYRPWLFVKRGQEPDWVEPTVAVLMSDRCIELARNVNPELHRILLVQLVRAVKRQKS